MRALVACRNFFVSLDAPKRAFLPASRANAEQKINLPRQGLLDFTAFSGRVRLFREKARGLLETFSKILRLSFRVVGKGTLKGRGKRQCKHLLQNRNRVQEPGAESCIGLPVKT